MPARPVLEHPNPRLRQVAAPVSQFDAALGVLVDDLVATLVPTTGIGISAPQLGERSRVVILELSERKMPAEIYVNPRLLSKSGFAIIQESCLSLPGVTGNVIRATQVKVCANDVNGQVFERELNGMAAVAMLHELDHLDGVLFVDRLTLLGRLKYKWSQRQAASDIVETA